MKDPIEVKKRVGYLPEHNPLYPDMYVQEYLEFAARMQGMKKFGERVEEMIAVTGLSPERKKKIGQLSKGYRQRVGLAQAMLHDPEVLILDEPPPASTPTSWQTSATSSRPSAKKTVILSTHIMQEVQALVRPGHHHQQGSHRGRRQRGRSQARSSGATIVQVSFKGKPG